MIVHDAIHFTVIGDGWCDRDRDVRVEERVQLPVGLVELKKNWRREGELFLAVWKDSVISSFT